MSEFKEVDDRKFGLYALNSDDLSGNIDAEELANACRRLGISGPLEPLLRDLKIKKDKYVSPSSPAIKDSPRKTSSQRKEKQRTSSSNPKTTRQSPDLQKYDQFDSKGNSTGSASGFGKNSYGKESWGRDSGARDLSPEPNMHRMHETLSTENKPMDTETGGTSAMLHLASKVSISTQLHPIYSNFFQDHHSIRTKDTILRLIEVNVGSL